MIHLLIDENNAEHLEVKLELENKSLAKKITHVSGLVKSELIYEDKTYVGLDGLKEFLVFIEPYTTWDVSICDNWDGVC